VNPGIHSLSFHVGDRGVEVLKSATELLPVTRNIVLEVDGGDREFQAIAHYLSKFGFRTWITDWRIARATRDSASG
jgi:hypothetical protein